MRQTSSSQFIQWMEYIHKLKLNEFHREDIHVARILQAIYQNICKHSEKGCPYKYEDFLLKFDFDKQLEDIKKVELDYESTNKSAWFAGLGLPMEEEMKSIGHSISKKEQSELEKYLL
jgi:hypothetical protein